MPRFAPLKEVGQGSGVRSFAGPPAPAPDVTLGHQGRLPGNPALGRDSPPQDTQERTRQTRTDDSSLPDQEKLPNALAQPLYNMLCSKENMNHPNYLHCLPIKRLLLHLPHFLLFPLLRPSTGSDPDRLLCPAAKEKGGWIFTLLMALPNVIWSDFRSCGEQKW